MKLLRGPVPGRLTMVEHGGTVFSDPHEVDKKAREHWGTIYSGNIALDQLWSRAIDFVEQYRAYIPEVPVYEVRDIVAQDVLVAFTTSS
eukprot:11302766-Alexandrium_andersonii.AAC.1